MKNALLFVMFVLLPGMAWVQGICTDVYRLGALPAQGVVHDSDWGCYPNDDFAYATINRQTRDGLPVNPTADSNDLLQVKEASVGWFILQLKLDSLLHNKTLAYDMVTKEHGGSIKVESNEGEYSRFIIQLPIE